MLSNHLKAALGLCALLLLAASLQLYAAPAFALEELKLEGTGFLDEEACAKGLQAAGCNLTFQLEGKAAKQLFEGMADKEQREECTGGLEKTDGQGLHCIRYDDGTYLCDFGYYFKDKAFCGGSVSC